MQYCFDLALWFKSQGMKEPPTCIREIVDVEQVLKGYVTSQYPSPAHKAGMLEVARQLLAHPKVVFVTDKTTFDNAFVFAEKTRIYMQTVKMNYGQHEPVLASRLKHMDEESKAYMLVRALYSDEYEMRVMYCEVTQSIVPMETYIRQYTIDQFLEVN